MNLNLIKKKEMAVSPVVGVMLMLVVTIIIAAVVSGFAGGFGADQKKAPMISLDSKIVNTGYWGSSYVKFLVQNVDKPIPTKDLKIITTWQAADGTRGGANVTGWTNKTTFTVNGTTYYGNSHYGTYNKNSPGTTHAPYGFGPGVNRSCQNSNNCVGGAFYPDMMFGNFTLMAGTNMQNGPSSNYGRITGSISGGNAWSERYEYTVKDGYWDPDTCVDTVQAILGKEWNHLRAGDVVKVQFVHLPSGKVIYDQDIVVEG